jgi:hypothetical protein
MTFSRRRTPAAAACALALLIVGARARAAVRWAGLGVETPGAGQGKPPAVPPAGPAAPALPTAVGEQGTALLANVRDHGTYEEGDALFPPRFGFEDVKGSTDAAHTADYATVFGLIDDDGLFHPGFVDIVSEKWSVDPNDDWVIEQWVFTVRVDGRVRSAAHRVVRESRRREALGREDKGLDGVLPAFDALVQRWARFQPAPK